MRESTIMSSNNSSTKLFHTVPVPVRVQERGDAEEASISSTSLADKKNDKRGMSASTLDALRTKNVLEIPNLASTANRSPSENLPSAASTGSQNEKKEEIKLEASLLTTVRAPKHLILRICESFLELFKTNNPPMSTVHMRWNVIVMLCIVYNTFFLSFRAAFGRKMDSDSGFAFYTFLDYICDIVYLIDMGVNFRTAFYENGILKDDIRSIALHYFKVFHISSLLYTPGIFYNRPPISSSI